MAAEEQLPYCVTKVTIGIYEKKSPWGDFGVLLEKKDDLQIDEANKKEEK